jgi:hypothetical protein
MSDHVVSEIKTASLRLPPQLSSHLAESTLRFDLREKYESAISFRKVEVYMGLGLLSFKSFAKQIFANART